MSGDLNLDRALVPAAVVMFTRAQDQYLVDNAPTWADLLAEVQGWWSDTAREAIVAALPHIRQQLAEMVEAMEIDQFGSDYTIVYDAARIVRGSNDNPPPDGPDSRKARQDASGVAPEASDGSDDLRAVSGRPSCVEGQ